MARSARSRGRGRLSKIDLMPEECDEIIAWAARELADRSRTQVDIYGEFVSKLEALGWSPTIDLATGLRTTYEWYLDQLDRNEALRGVDAPTADATA